MNWITDTLVLTDDPSRPEFCEVCSDMAEGLPPRATEVRDGTRCCESCAEGFDLDNISVVHSD